MISYRSIFIKLLFVGCLISANANAQDEEQMAIFSAKDVVTLPVFSSEIRRNLGAACDKNFSYEDAKGMRYKAFNSGRVIKDAEPGYICKYSFQQISNSLELSAHLKLFAGSLGGGIKEQSESRYAILSVYQIDSTETYEPEGAAVVADADMYIRKIYYGWAIHYLVYGNSGNFTTEAKVDFEAILKTGANFNKAASKQNLSSTLKTLGLTPKDAGKVVLEPDAIVGSFKTSGAPQPILVEFKPIKEVSVKAIPWATKKVIPGRYSLEYVKVVMKSTKASNGKAWDIGWGKTTNPDPKITIYLDNQELDNKMEKDVEPLQNDSKNSKEKQIAFTLQFQKTLPIVEQTEIRINIIDVDNRIAGGSDDFIGEGVIKFDELSKHSIDEEIEVTELRGKGSESHSLHSLKIKLKKLD